MSTFLTTFSIMLLFLTTLYIRNSNSADCQSQPFEENCRQESGCEWVNGACRCASDVDIDIIFAVDSSGSIGSAGFKIEKDWLVDFVQSGLPLETRIGWIIFSTDSDNSRVTLSYWDINNLVNYIKNIPWMAGWTNTRDALQQAIDEYNLNGVDDRQKLLIITTDGNPCYPRIVCPADVCDYASPIKAAGINVIVIGVGDEWSQENIDCLVQDAANIIYVQDFTADDFNKILPQLQEITCPVDFNLKFTEIKIEQDTSANVGRSFIEIYNQGSEVNGNDLLFNGFVVGTLPSNIIIKQGQYLVLYYDDNSGNNITCIDCDCNPESDGGGGVLQDTVYWCNNSIYYQCDNINTPCSFDFNMDNKNWFISVNDTSGTNNNVLIDQVTYDDNNNWPTIIDGYTYKLLQIGFNNNDGANWAQSCNVHGTPGDPPINNCTQTCTIDTCKQNGANDVDCNQNTGKCICNTVGYYSDDDTCKLIPPPGECVAYRIKNLTTSEHYMRYIWNSADFEISHQYQLIYWNRDGTNTSVTTYSRIKSSLEYDWDKRGINNVAGTVSTYFSLNEKSKEVLCWPQTMEPTPEPTDNPTISPTNNPSKSPTMSPTYSIPWLFLDLCLLERCDCNSQFIDPTCCMNELFIEDNCTEHSKSYGKSSLSNGQSDNGNGNNPQYITLNSIDPYGNSFKFPYLTNIYYQFTFVGFTNITNFTWDDYSNDDDDDDERDNYPMIITPAEGILQLYDDSSIRVQFYIKTYKGKVIDNGGNMIFRLKLLNCSANYTANDYPNMTDIDLIRDCRIIYPDSLLLNIQQFKSSGAAVTTWEEELGAWLWWIIAAFVIFILIIAALVYLFWKKTKKKGISLLAAENELNELIEEDELGFGNKLDDNDIGYNPLALGGKGKKPIISGISNANNPDDPISNEKANVMVERFQERKQFGATYGSIKPVDQSYQAPQFK